MREPMMNDKNNYSWKEFYEDLKENIKIAGFLLIIIVAVALLIIIPTVLVQTSLWNSLFKDDNTKLFAAAIFDYLMILVILIIRLIVKIIINRISKRNRK